jgi:hypothetical protein
MSLMSRSMLGRMRVVVFRCFTTYSVSKRKTAN